MEQQEDVPLEVAQELFGIAFGLKISEGDGVMSIETANGTLGVDIRRPVSLAAIDTAISILKDKAIRMA